MYYHHEARGPGEDERRAEECVGRGEGGMKAGSRWSSELCLLSRASYMFSSRLYLRVGMHKYIHWVVQAEVDKASRHRPHHYYCSYTRKVALLRGATHQHQDRPSSQMCPHKGTLVHTQSCGNSHDWDISPLYAYPHIVSKSNFLKSMFKSVLFWHLLWPTPYAS